MAVVDYIKMFPEEYKLFLKHIEQLRGGLKEDFATLPGAHAIHRQLLEMPEKLSVMIGKKLDDVERASFKEKENQRWFAREFSQFAVSKNV